MVENAQVVMYSMVVNYAVVILYFMYRWENKFLSANRSEC